MALVIEARSKDGLLVQDLTVAPFSLTYEGIRFGKIGWTDPGKVKRRNKIRVTGADREMRSIGWVQQIDQTTLDLLNTAYQSLKNIICQPEWILRVNAGGATEQNKYYECWEVETVPDLTNRELLTQFHKFSIDFDAKPYAYLTSVDLPKNYIVDAAMCDDSNGDGLANSWEISTVGAGTAASSIVNGRQRLSLSDGDATSFIYLNQTITTIEAGANFVSIETDVVSEIGNNAEYGWNLIFNPSGTLHDVYIPGGDPAEGGPVTWSNHCDKTVPIPAGTTSIYVQYSIMGLGASAGGALSAGNSLLIQGKRYAGLLGGYVEPNTLAGLQLWESAIDKTADIYQYFLALGDPWSAAIDAIGDAGHKILCFLETWDPAGGVTQPAWKLSTITAGDHDPALTDLAQVIKSKTYDVWISLFSEFSGDWTPWGVGNGDSAPVNGNLVTDLIPAYQHIVKLFAAQGVTNVKWVWNPNEEASAQATWVDNNCYPVDITPSFPAADVDVINDRITAAAHGLTEGMKVRLTTTDTLPSPLLAGTDYYVAWLSVDVFGLRLTPGGAEIDLLNQGVGTHTATFAYVDYIGIDGFNWGPYDPPTNGGWRSFETIFKPSYDVYHAAHAAKPIIVASGGCNGAGGDKAQWFTDMWTYLKTVDISALVWFNVIKEADWRVEETGESLTAFKAVIVLDIPDDMFWCSGFAETPATAIINNLPGDADADALIAFAGAAHTATECDDIFMLGNSFHANNLSLVKSFSAAADADCLGGVCSALTAFGDQLYIDTTLRGRFLVVGRLWSDSTTWPNDKFRISQYAGAVANSGNGYHAQYVYPFRVPVNADYPTLLVNGVASSNYFYTESPANPGVSVAHNMVVGDVVVLEGTVPAGVSAGVGYFIQSVPSPVTFTLAATSGGPQIDITTDANGFFAEQVGASGRWCDVVFGQLEFPLGVDPDWTDYANRVYIEAAGTAGTGWKVDYLAFLPLDNGYLRAEIGKLGDDNMPLAVVLDTISDNPGVHKISCVSAPIVYPFDAASVPLSENHEIDPVTLKAGVDNRMLIMANGFSGTAGVVHSVDPVAMSIRYRARLLR